MDNLDALTARVAEQGMTLPDEEGTANGVREAAYRDADGNEFGFGWRRDIAGGFQPGHSRSEHGALVVGSGCRARPTSVPTTVPGRCHGREEMENQLNTSATPNKLEL